MHYDRDLFRRLQMKSRRYLRMKLSSFVYRSDLLIVFAMVIIFSLLFNFLSWLHEQPDGTKINLSYARQQYLINEWKQKHHEAELERQGAEKLMGQDGLQGGKHGQYEGRINKDASEDDNVDVVINSKKRDVGGGDFEDFDVMESSQREKKENLVMKDFEVDLIKKDFDDYNAVYVLREKVPHGDDLNTNSKKLQKHEGESLDDPLGHKNLDLLNADLLPLNVAAPLGGKLVGGPAQCTVYNMEMPIEADYECLNIAIKPTLKVCLYPNAEDIHISQHIRNTGIWEPHIVKEFQNILFSNPEYGVIDIGANIGLYSLIAARMGHDVVSVEPYKENLYHFHKAVNLGGFASRVTVVRNVVSDVRKNYVSLWVDPENHGGVQIDQTKKNPCIHENCTKTVKSIYMDDLLEVINFKKAVMKMDIEGHEHKAFTHSTALFDKVYISHIIMEWMQLRAYYGAETTQSKNKELVHQTVATLHRRGYAAFSLVTGVKLKPDYWFSWPDDIIWKHELEDFN